MKEDGCSWWHFTIVEFHAFQDCGDAFRVDARLCASLVGLFGVFQPSEPMAPADNLQAAVVLCLFIDSDHHGNDIRKQTTKVVPVTIILMPLPGTADFGLFEHHC